MASFSVKEKDEASLPNCFRENSWNAFILCLAGVFTVVPEPTMPALVAVGAALLWMKRRRK